VTFIGVVILAGVLALLGLIPIALAWMARNRRLDQMKSLEEMAEDPDEKDGKSP